MQKIIMSIDSMFIELSELYKKFLDLMSVIYSNFSY